MKEIRLCDDADITKILDLCINNNLGIEIQGFYNPSLIDSDETLNLLETHCPNAIWNIECKLDYIEETVNFLKNKGYIK